MQKISVGDVYFLKPILNSTVSPEHAKKLAYLLGTVSERPCVIIRAPFAWDPYGEVEVLAGLSSAKPTIKFNMHDIYGFKGCDYSFAPHSTHSIAIARLGRYIGHLELPELKELLYAYHWIHDPFMQMDPDKYPIPECYKEAFENLDEIESDPEIKNHYEPVIVDRNLKVVSDNLKGTQIDINLQNATNPHFAKQVQEEGIIPKADNIHEEHEHEVVTFPVSSFSLDDLKTYANKFNYPIEYYSGKVKVKDDTSILTDDERDRVIANVDEETFDDVCKIYNDMKPVDRDILAVHLPTAVLSKLLHIKMKHAACLKRLCNVMVDITDYDERVKKKEEQPKIDAQHRKEMESRFKLRYPIWNDYNMIKREIVKIRPYLNKSSLMSIPRDLMPVFIRIPANVIRKTFTGKMHQMMYADAYQRCKSTLMKELEDEFNGN